jgi:hypothetical protein
MPDRIALLLGDLIVATLLMDLVVLQSGSTLFLLRKLAEIVEYLAFWR